MDNNFWSLGVGLLYCGIFGDGHAGKLDNDDDLIVYTYTYKTNCTYLSTYSSPFASPTPLSDIMAETFPPSSLRSLVSEVSRLLKDRGETVSVAETVSPRLPSPPVPPPLPVLTDVHVRGVRVRRGTYMYHVRCKRLTGMR